MAELRVGATTHTGQLRPANEDNLLNQGGVYVVADGMGGHEAGEVASQIAVERIAQLIGGDDLPTAEDVVAAIKTANGDIYRAAIANPGQQGMGTTVTAIAVIADPFAGRNAPNIVDPPAPSDEPAPAEPEDLPGDVTPIIPSEPSEALALANVGDSRTYLFRHGRLRRVTIDHSYVQELISTGHLDEAEARNHPRRNIITRALGIEPDVRVDWWTLPLIKGDRFVLCSDGLVDEIDDVEIAATLQLENDPQVAADRLVDKANDAGGRDNITVIVIDVLAGDDPPDPTQEIDPIPVWADTATDPTPAGTLEVDADPFASPPVDAPVSTDEPQPPARTGRRNAKRFFVAFAVSAVVVVAVVVFSVWARSGFFVAFDNDDEAIIYQGRSVLWFEPTAETEGGPERSEFEPDVAAEIDTEPRFDTFDDAVAFIVGGATATTTTTPATTVVTTTTVAPTTTTAPPTTTTGP